MKTVFVIENDRERDQPAPPPGFGGKIERNAAQSNRFAKARVVPPKGAPNVLLIMTDDVGFGAPSTFSSLGSSDEKVGREGTGLSS